MMIPGCTCETCQTHGPHLPGLDTQLTDLDRAAHEVWFQFVQVVRPVFDWVARHEP